MNLRSMFPALVLAGTLLALSVPGVAMAAEVRTGTSGVVAPGETIDDDLFVTGQTITIAGRVTGDVFATGQSVIVTGTIDGDLIAAAQQVVVDGTVNGNVRAAGSVITINGHVARSVSGLAQQVNLTSSSRLDGSLQAAGETISVFGPIGRGVTAGGGSLQLGGPVGGQVLTWSRTMSLGPNTRIGGNLEYHAEQQAEIPGDAVAGRVQFDPIEQRQRQAPLLNGLFDFGGLIWLVGSAILGALAIVFAPRASARALEMGRQQPWPTFGFGLLALCGVPVAAVLICITLVGIPVAVALAAAYCVGLMLAWPALALLVGTEIAQRVRREPLPVLGSLVLGLLVLHLVTHLPVVGGLVAFLGLTFGLGLIVQSFRRWQRPPEPVRVAVPAPVPA